MKQGCWPKRRSAISSGIAFARRRISASPALSRRRHSAAQPAQTLTDHLLPAGNLREALRAAGRAHVIAIPADEPELEAEIKSRGWRAKIWRLRRQMEVPQLDGPVAAFCGIARPEQFFAGLERGGVQLATRIAFRDHHRYTAADLSRIAAHAQKAGATALLTTEKDRVRLGPLADSLPAALTLQVVTLQIEIENEKAAIDSLIEAVRGPR